MHPWTNGYSLSWSSLTLHNNIASLPPGHYLRPQRLARFLRASRNPSPKLSLSLSLVLSQVNGKRQHRSQQGRAEEHTDKVSTQTPSVGEENLLPSLWPFASVRQRRSMQSLSCNSGIGGQHWKSHQLANTKSSFLPWTCSIYAVQGVVFQTIRRWRWWRRRRRPLISGSLVFHCGF